jgi:hypothetical protein
MWKCKNASKSFMIELFEKKVPGHIACPGLSKELFPPC